MFVEIRYFFDLSFSIENRSILLLYRNINIVMGQEIISNSSCTNSEEDVLSRELSVYKWRADPHFNTHVARTSFKSASLQQQEELFAEFLAQQEKKEYLELFKFKQRINRVNSENNQTQEKIVVFEQYQSNLKNHKQ